MNKLVLLIAAFIGGYLFNFFNIPAGWLLGAMLVGAFYRLFIGDVSYSPMLFDLALAVIGISIGLTIKIIMFKQVASFLLPLAVSMFTLLAASWLLGKLLERKSSLDPKTALFCCIPAGASVMMALSREYKANLSMVAAFQTVRIMLLVSTIPITAGFMSSFIETDEVQKSSIGASVGVGLPSSWLGFVLYAFLIGVTLFIAGKWKIPIAPFLYAIILGFLFNTFIHALPSMPNLLVGGGMAMLGVIIGLRFDRESVAEFKSIGWTSLGVLMAFFILTFLSTFVFYLLTPLDFITSLLAVVPAGAPQMASVASLLHLDASIVAAMQVIRLLAIVVLIPLIIPFLVKTEKT
ncbi:AbrB family transcriptional regulator [Pseudalkalibacillus caeni]|uniref:AbrB family transcriptional regulator n=1 Tax=Exobacillus caeni TaxID=2574798 RepID=A0A5R9FBD1_9BACL|nr:AbrB family transcriptional regulator [Pseudalkalibacillus caeni]TLS36935.1 AbrB family transcriptional regulator [Pseudalkalibacillus caeni]